MRADLIIPAPLLMLIAVHGNHNPVLAFASAQIRCSEGEVMRAALSENPFIYFMCIFLFSDFFLFELGRPQDFSRD